MNSLLKPKLLTHQEAQTLQANPVIRVVDIYHIQTQELARVHDPSQSSGKTTVELSDAWVHYAAQSLLLHCVDEQAMYQLRTNRNQLLVTTQQQQQLKQAVVGVAGMSVGSGIAIGLAYAGISQTIKIADFDELDTSNLNRLREAVHNVGRPKAELAAERIYDVDPFADVRVFAEGLSDETLPSFFDDPKLNVVVDEIDDFAMKVRIRQEAKHRGIPVVMFTSLGDNILVDVERYDLDPAQRPFNGILDDDGAGILSHDSVTPEDIKRYSIQLVGQQYVPTKAIQSLLEMGKTLVGRPQLYSTIAVDGGLATYLIRQILLEEGPGSGRYFVKFSELFGLPSTDLEDGPERASILSRLHGSKPPQ